jgi:hypothetical protein
MYAFYFLSLFDRFFIGQLPEELRVQKLEQVPITLISIYICYYNNNPSYIILLLIPFDMVTTTTPTIITIPNDNYCYLLSDICMTCGG